MILLLLALASGVYSREETLDLPVSVSFDVELPAPVVESLRSEAERIFARAGVTLRWLTGRESGFASVLVTDVPPGLLGKAGRSLVNEKSLGMAFVPTRDAFLWTERVARAVSGEWNSRKKPKVRSRELGLALGRALAHELGHLVLEEREHRKAGIMRAVYTKRDLTGDGTHALEFSPEETRQLRERVASDARAVAASR